MRDIEALSLASEHCLARTLMETSAIRGVCLLAWAGEGRLNTPICMIVVSPMGTFLLKVHSNGQHCVL